MMVCGAKVAGYTFRGEGSVKRSTPYGNKVLPFRVGAFTERAYNYCA